MYPQDRAKNAAYLCCHFTRNLAYYSAGRKLLRLDREDFWLTSIGNLTDICVLEWCKLFGNRNGEYHWQKVLLDPRSFKISLLSITQGQTQLDDLYTKVKTYRDTFVAHTEDDETITVPNMDVPYALVLIYYAQLRRDFSAVSQTQALPEVLENYFLFHFGEAEVIYKSSAPTKCGDA